MDIHILNVWDSTRFIPTVPTYALRINNSGRGAYNKDDFQEEFRLKDSNLWVAVKEYGFDDIESLRSGVSIDDDIAMEMFRDFSVFRDRCEALMVHCHNGKGRAPSVARAFNSVYNLGRKDREFVDGYPDNNGLVYRTLERVGPRIVP